MATKKVIPFLLTQIFILNLNVTVWSQSIDRQSERPNILWIIIEDMSPDLACYGNDLVHTPNIDALAGKGIQFANVFATSAACSPSRTALVTGFYQDYIGAYHMRYPDDLQPRLPDTIAPLPIHMKDLGYQTANIRSFPGNGKTDWLFQYRADAYDVQNWEDLTHQPFFARINLRWTHRPFVQDTVHPIDPHTVTVPPYYPDHIVAKEDFAAYYESIQIMDQRVGRVLSDLKKYHLSENTLIFFFSDHGRSMPRAKNYLYDSGIQVPLLVTTLDDELREKMNLQGVNSSLFSLIDVTATTLDVAGGDGIYTQGISVFQQPSGREYLWAATDRMGEIHFKSRMIRTKKYKYIRNYRHDFSVNSASTAHRKARYPIYHLLDLMYDNGDLNADQAKLVEPMVAEELYDIVSDPYELDNLAEEENFHFVLQTMRDELKSFSKKIKDQGLEKDSKVIVEAFDKYGQSSMKKNKIRILELREKIEKRVEKNKN